VRRIGVAASILAAIIVTSWMTRGYLARGLPPLKVWHTTDLGTEFRARDYRDGISFAEYQALEGQLMQRLTERISDQLAEEDRLFSNRYFALSPAHPNAWPRNWNLSFERLHPDPKGAIVLLHGASDSPYSMRTLADRFAAAGLHVIVPRLPGNGTLPGELLNVSSADWTAITHMAVQHARSLVGDAPVLIGGYSTGAALALQHALLSARDHKPGVDGLLFFSPAIGVTGFAALARWDLLLSKIWLFRKFAWLHVWPEYDPFKYASFPKQAGHIVHDISTANRTLSQQLENTPAWSTLPPIITFQSVVDETVDVGAVLDFHQSLPTGRHQLVLFDVNRSSGIAPFLKIEARTVSELATRHPVGNTDLTVVGNLASGSDTVVARRYCDTAAACIAEQILAARWPTHVYSLSHIALPFPPQDPLYGDSKAQPAPKGYNLGQLAPKGERNVLVIPAEDLNRLRYNPFFEYMASRALGFCAVCDKPTP
jgi:alpha-beta hydrolase superfamily lysophospholipase